MKCWAVGVGGALRKRFVEIDGEGGRSQRELLVEEDARH
jgi:hypothetical protein